MTIAQAQSGADNISVKPARARAPDWRGAIAVIVAMTAMRLVYAHALDLRTDEAYYWTWWKENVLSFLDHPPMVAWFIRFGTAPGNLSGGADLDFPVPSVILRT